MTSLTLLFPHISYLKCLSLALEHFYENNMLRLNLDNSQKGWVEFIGIFFVILRDIKIFVMLLLLCGAVRN
jgi:hypothetical protein